VGGFYFGYPEAKYFGVGKIGRDQMLNYQQRKGMPLERLKRWLDPWLNYRPHSTAEAQDFVRIN